MLRLWLPWWGWGTRPVAQTEPERRNGSGHLSYLGIEKGRCQVSEPRQDLLSRRQPIHLFLQHSLIKGLPWTSHCLEQWMCAVSRALPGSLPQSYDSLTLGVMPPAQMTQWQSWGSNPNHATLSTLGSLPGPSYPLPSSLPGLLIPQLQVVSADSSTTVRLLSPSCWRQAWK